jgi:beta-glucosidase
VGFPTPTAERTAERIKASATVKAYHEVSKVEYNWSMAQATFHFPRGFLWGTATAAYQVEGNNTHSNWYAWESQAGRIKNGHKSGLACDWWGGRWREDFDRIQETGQNAHRLSVEWGRIQPAPDRWDEEALDRYLEMLRSLRERSITPMVTLHHYTEPQWLAEQGGWENDQAPAYFEKYVSKVVEVLKEYVTLWITINEPNGVITHSYILGDYPPGKLSLRTAFRAGVNLVRAHALAYHAIHKLQPQARVGIALLYRGFEPARAWLPLDRWSAGMQSRSFNDMFPRALDDGLVRTPFGNTRVAQAEHTQDFLGVNYYTRDLVKFDLLKPTELFGRRFYRTGAALSDNAFIAHEPEGLYQALKWGLQFKVPMMVTENGIEDATDHLRPRYLIQHLHQVWRAVNFNWPIKGYFHWTLVDNFEWSAGWTMRFGLWELDPETQTRRKRPSADLYAEICRENGISSEMVARFAPEIFNEMFPN